MRFVVLTLLSLLSSTVAVAATTIVKDGQPQAVIITAEKPSASADQAAKELQRFIELMSGAKLPIQTDAAPPSGQTLLLVGRSKLVSGVPIPSGTDHDFSREGFVLKTRGKNLILAGNEDGDVNGSYHGTEYAVYELLERLGCRWYFPGDFGQVVPKLKTIEIPDLDVKQQPSFPVRNIWTSGWADVTGEMDQWMLRNKGTIRKDPGFAFPGDGSIHNLAPVEKYGKDFPEIYAMQRNGQRLDEKTSPERTMLCMSSAKGIEIAAKTIGDYFRANPQANSYGFSPPDAAAMCYCPDCTRRLNHTPHDLTNLPARSEIYINFIKNSISDPYYNFVNNLAWEVNKEFPDKYLVTLAYATRVLPPEGLDRPWNPNIIIHLAQFLVSARSPIGKPTDFFALQQERTLRGWSRMAPKMLIYDYDPHADLSRMPFWRSRAVASDLRLYHKNHVVGFTTEGNNTFFRTGLNYYIRACLMWDVNADVEALIADYYRRFFGPAVTPMQQVGESIESMLQTSIDHMAWQPFNVDWTPTYPPEKIAALAPLLERAEKLADTDELRQRVRMYRILHTYMTNYLRVHTLQHEGKYREALAVVDTLPATIAEAQAIQKGLLPPDPEWVLKDGSGLSYLKTHLTALADRAGGEMGELLGRAPVTAQFVRDPKNIGLFEQWQREEIGAAQKWLPIDLRRNWGLNGHRDEEGRSYDGIGWYRIVLPVKKPTTGRAQLFIPLVFTEKAWVWFNGHLVASPTNFNGDPKTGPIPGQAVRNDRRGFIQLAIDVHDQLRPDANNTITIRLQGTLDRTQRHGLSEVPIVWAPKK